MVTGFQVLLAVAGLLALFVVCRGAMDVNFLTGPQAYADGTKGMPRLGRQGEIIASEYRGKYGEANSRGQVYHFCTLVAGQTLPIFTNTAHTYGLRNPA